MRSRRVWAAAAAGVAIAVAIASLPWGLDPDKLIDRLNDGLAPAGAHWERPTSATLRLFPEPILDVYGLRLADASGTVVFRASTAAARLSVFGLLAGRYEVLRARVKEPIGELDVDALIDALPTLVRSPGHVFLQARGGQVHFKSRRFGVDETVAPINASLGWTSGDEPCRVTFGGVWRGQWANLDFTVDPPNEFVAGRTSDVKLSLTTSDMKASLDGALTVVGTPSYAGRVVASAASLANSAAWLGLDIPNLPDAEGSVTGKISVAPGVLSLDDGEISFRGQKLDGSIALQSEAGRWSASATLAGDQVDLSRLFGEPPPLTDEFGRWSRAPVLTSLPPFDLDMRLSAAAVNWGSASFTDAAVTLTRHEDEATFKILEAGYAGGQLNGEVIVKDCADRCSTRATLTLANADARALTRSFGRSVVNGVATADLDLSAYGASPATLIWTAEGELALTVRDGSIEGLNFEEALRRSQRRALDVSRDLLVGQTGFRKLEGKLFFNDGVARSNDLKMSGPGVLSTASGAIDISDRSLEARIDARQADALGHLSPDGASLALRLAGPWSRPTLAAEAPSN